MNPLQIARLMSGDWTALLPASVQPLARQILGQEQRSGVSGFLNQAQGFLGGNTNGGGLLGGMGNLFGQASQSGQPGLGNILGTFTNALGGRGQASSAFGLPNLNNLIPGGAQGILPNIQNLIPGTQGVLPGLQNLVPNVQGAIQGAPSSMQGASSNFLNNIGFRHH